MIDEIDYFPKRDKFKKNKPVDDDWNALKKKRKQQDSKIKDGKKSPVKNPPPQNPDPKS